MKKRPITRQALVRFALDNLGIAAFGALVPLLVHISPFFDGKEAIFGAVAGLYWIPPLRNVASRLTARPDTEPGPRAAAAEFASSSTPGGTR